MNTYYYKKGLSFIHFYRIGTKAVTVFTDGRSILVGLFNPMNRFCTLKEAFEVGEKCKVFKSEEDAVKYMKEF